MRKTTSKLMALLMVLVMLSVTVVYAAPGGNSELAFDRKVLARIDADRALEHIRYLSEEIGPRVAGTEEERQAAEYIGSVFEDYGYAVEIQEFDMHNVVAELFINTLNNLELVAKAAIGSGMTDGEGITLPIVDCGLGMTADEFPAEVNGNIALVSRGVIGFGIKAQNAVAAGAKGVIIYNNVPGSLNPTLSGYESPVPVVAITQADGSMLLGELANGEVIATIKTQLFTKSQNVIATRKPDNKNKDTNQIVYLTAHYDSVPGAPGANDNASGTALMLEFARILKSYPIDKEVRFIACGTEELGMIGSRYYTSQLADEEIERSLLNLNMDMVATSDENCSLMYVSTINGIPNIATEYAMAAGARLGNSSLYPSQGGSSDHIAFYEVGIDAVEFIRRAPSGSLEPWYHTPDDTIEKNISMERLQEAGEMIGITLYDVLRTETPNIEKVRGNRTEEVQMFYMNGEQE